MNESTPPAPPIMPSHKSERTLPSGRRFAAAPYSFSDISSSVSPFKQSPGIPGKKAKKNVASIAKIKKNSAKYLL